MVDERVRIASNEEMATVHPRKLIIALKTYGYYFRLAVFPYRLGLYHKKLWALGVNKIFDKEYYRLDLDFWIGLGILLGNIYGILFLNNPIGFGLLWFNLGIAMWCNLITIHQPIAERYIYLPAVGIMLAISYACSLIHPFAWLIPFTAYAVRFIYIAPSYISEFWNTHYNLIEQKDFWYIWLVRGVKRFKLNDDIGAYNDFAEAYRLCQHSFKVNFNLANMSILFKNLDQAQKHLDIAKKNIFDGEGLKEEQYKLIQNVQDFINEIKDNIAKGIKKNYDRARILIAR